ncbi:MAG TPA: hypothetical protein VF581_05370 [Flavobacterium sp.]|jgi:hypothetical protein
MSASTFRPVLEVIILAVVSFLLHILLFYVLGIETRGFTYSILQQYTWFLAGSLFTTLVVIFVRQRNIDSVGSTMMLLTCGKMVPAYMVMHPVITLNDAGHSAEKVNFLIIFGIFLIIDTLIAIRLLNRNG